MKKILLIATLMSSGAAFGAAGGLPAGAKPIYNPRTKMIEIWQGGKMIHSQPMLFQEQEADPAADIARRNELRTKAAAGGLTAAEQAEYNKLLQEYPIRGAAW